MLARAELAHSERVRSPSVPDVGPELVPPLETNRPRGLAAVIDASLGSVELPNLSEMSHALAQIADKLAGDGQADDPLNDVLVAVLGEEKDKIERYLKLREL